jgi:hypothetical protein
MVIFRLIALILVVVALLLLGYDALRWLQNGEGFVLTSLTDFINIVAQYGAEDTKWAPPESWPDFVKTAMGWPSWAVIGVVGLVLALIFRRRD